MDLESAITIAKDFLNSEEFDNAKIEQDKDWDCSVIIGFNYLTQDALETLHQIMTDTPDINFLLEDEEIRIFTPEPTTKKKTPE